MSYHSRYGSYRRSNGIPRPGKVTLIFNGVLNLLLTIAGIAMIVVLPGYGKLFGAAWTVCTLILTIINFAGLKNAKTNYSEHIDPKDIKITNRDYEMLRRGPNNVSSFDRDKQRLR